MALYDLPLIIIFYVVLSLTGTNFYFLIDEFKNLFLV